MRQWDTDIYIQTYRDIYRYLYFKEWTEVDYNLLICSNRNQTWHPNMDIHSHSSIQWQVAFDRLSMLSPLKYLHLTAKSVHSCLFSFSFLLLSIIFSFFFNLHTATTSQLPSAFSEEKYWTNVQRLQNSLFSQEHHVVVTTVQYCIHGIWNQGNNSTTLKPLKKILHF